MSVDEYFLDTNIFVRFFVRDSEKTFRECKALFEVLTQGSMHATTSSTVVAEVHWLLKSYYKINKADSTDYVDRILGNPSITIDNRDDARFANTLFREHGIKFIDALIASHPLIQDGSMTIISYDKDFDALGVKRIEPRALKKKR